MNAVAIIPARMKASRFPNKPMAKILGIPMIGHCYARTIMTKGIAKTYVATCDLEIFEYIKSIGGNAVMTADTHERATDRCAEAVGPIESEMGCKIDIIAMVQGDEPLVSPDMIAAGLKPFSEVPGLKLSNLMTKLPEERFSDANEVKVVFDLKMNALYFSREGIPSRKKWNDAIPMYKQLGIMFFTREFLTEYSAMEPTPLEKIESVDMNRVLEHGERIKMVPVDFVTVGVDIPSDLDRAEVLMRDDALFPTYQHLRGQS